jgi:hypothetical protein
MMGEKSQNRKDKIRLSPEEIESIKRINKKV